MKNMQLILFVLQRSKWKNPECQKTIWLGKVAEFHF